MKRLIFECGCDKNKTLGNCYGNIKIVPLQEVEK